MAMAAVRLAARRLITGQQHPSVPASVRDERLMAVSRKKEEIYDMLAEIQLDRGVPRRIRMKDRRLLQRLTDHVHPRPSNSQWHQYRREHAINFFSGGVASFCGGLYVYEKSTFSNENKDQGADTSSKPVSHV